MGLFDSLSDGLKNALGQAEAAAMPALISGVLAKTDLGNMQGLLNIHISYFGFRTFQKISIIVVHPGNTG